MSSVVQICNLALTRLGASTITSLTDGTTEAKLCNRLYNDILEEVLIEGPWSTVTKRAALNVTSNTPVYDFSYEFQLPTNPLCLKVLEINEEAPDTYSYAIEGDKLLANISTMSIKYIAKVTDPQLYGPALRRALVSRLAAEMAYTLTSSPEVVKTMYDLYDKHVIEGLAIDNQQGSKQTIQTNDLIEVR